MTLHHPALSEQANHFETKHAKTFATKSANTGLMHCNKTKPLRGC
jgi:hypothetical protein